MNDYSKNNFTLISEILDIEKTNSYLRNKYNIVIADKYNVKFDIDSIYYGINDKKINITNEIKNQFLVNSNIHIPKNTILNNINGDPSPGIVKKLYITYKINNEKIVEEYSENLLDDIYIGINHNNYKWIFGWINTYDNIIFEDILKNIYYHNNFMDKANKYINILNYEKKINIIHLRVESDAIDHWSKMNGMDKNSFRINLENKYIDIIKKYIDKNDETIILSSSVNNKIIDFLIENNYSYKLTYKYYNDRELNAIIDLLISKNCNNKFICNFNFNKLNGSTFSYYISKLLSNKVDIISIDLDHINDNYILHLN